MDELSFEETVSYKAWRRDGKLHKEDGPAVIYSDGLECYYFDGEQLTKERFDAWRKSLEKVDEQP